MRRFCCCSLRRRRLLREFDELQEFKAGPWRVELFDLGQGRLGTMAVQADDSHVSTSEGLLFGFKTVFSAMVPNSLLLQLC